MPLILKKIANPQDDASRLNKNFDDIALELANRSGNFSSLASVSGLVVSAGVTHIIEVSVVDNLEIYQINKLPVIPRLLVYVDNDQDGTYLLPGGSNLTAAEKHSITTNMYQTQIVINEVTNEKATYYIIIRNDDVASHTFYVYTDVYYVPAPEVGVARRALE